MIEVGPESHCKACGKTFTTPGILCVMDICGPCAKKERSTPEYIASQEGFTRGFKSALKLFSSWPQEFHRQVAKNG